MLDNVICNIVIEKKEIIKLSYSKMLFDIASSIYRWIYIKRTTSELCKALVLKRKVTQDWSKVN
jgi:hypothetical protein